MDDQDRTLDVIVAASAGTCFGVEMAIKLAIEQGKPVLGPLVHNPVVVEDLAARGIPIYERYEDLDLLQSEGISEVVVTAHGYPKELKEELEQRGIRYHDATCPVLLKWVYGKITRYEKQGYRVILIGNPGHAEIIASRSYGHGIHVVYSEEDVDRLPDDLGDTVAICQTTITKERFERLVAYIQKTKYPGLVAVDTRCKPVKNQQEAVEQLAQCVDVMVIIGGFNSSNTTNLVRISRLYLPDRTYHVDKPSGVQAEWLQGIERLGIGAGTSTPKQQIDLLKEKIEELWPGRIRFIQEEQNGETLLEEQV